MPAPAQPAGRRPGWIVYWALAGLAVLAAAGGAVTVLATVRISDNPTSMTMANTIRPRDVMLIDTAAPVRRGAVVAVREPAGYLLIRRVIGLPGDHVACCTAAGLITVNSRALRETYLYPQTNPSQRIFRVTVPPGKLWLMADNRLFAEDSRTFGPVAGWRVWGGVLLVLRSGHATLLRTPPAFVADGLAPAGTPVSAVLLLGAGAAVTGSALLVLLLLTGAIALLRSRLRRDPARAG